MAGLPSTTKEEYSFPDRLRTYIYTTFTPQPIDEANEKKFKKIRLKKSEKQQISLVDLYPSSVTKYLS